jgi:hypothetical protein
MAPASQFPAAISCELAAAAPCGVLGRVAFYRGARRFSEPRLLRRRWSSAHRRSATCSKIGSRSARRPSKLTRWQFATTPPPPPRRYPSLLVPPPSGGTALETCAAVGTQYFCCLLLHLRASPFILFLLVGLVLYVRQHLFASASALFLIFWKNGLLSSVLGSEAPL